ncbi:MAG: hypothetical protein IT422_09070 [Pirellulaceae bacterium]|jgi:ribonuclease Z|nr:hypothetical protein [Pirellulaceae bacterium]
MINFQILGEPGRDNAVLLSVDSGKAVHKLLFDCGYGCLDSVAIADIMSLDGVFFSHFHMDHVSGFDYMFRLNYNRSESPLRMFGPRDTRRVVQHRMQAYTWNLVDDAAGKVAVTEFGGNRLERCEFATKDQFRVPTQETSEPMIDRVVYAWPELTVSAIELDHGSGCISAGYVVRQADRWNVETSKLAELGLKPGPWLKQVTTIDDTPSSETIVIGERTFNVAELRGQLLKSTPGASFAYLTDFRPNDVEMEELVAFIKHVDVLVCENSYANQDLDLAVKNFHLCSDEVAQIAVSAEVGELVLFHLSDRYTSEDWSKQFGEVRRLFPRTSWPPAWQSALA